MIDFGEVELRVLAQLYPINLFRLRELDKPLAYAWAYGGTEPLRGRIDEEGCGSVFAAAVYGGNNAHPYPDGGAARSRLA